MDLVILSESELPIALRALRGVVESNGKVTPTGLSLEQVRAEYGIPPL